MERGENLHWKKKTPSPLSLPENGMIPGDDAKTNRKASSRNKYIDEIKITKIRYDKCHIL